MATAASSLAVPIASLALHGLAVRGALARGRALDEAAWLQVPFVGVAVTVLVLQFQLYLDVPVKHGVWALWGLAAVAGTVWLCGGTVAASLRSLPVLPLLTAAAVLAVQGFGLAAVGPDDYLGRSWSDQLNYVAEAEFFREQGFRLDYQSLGQRPWLVCVVPLKDHRIGQSVLHAYHGVLTGMDTRSQFMPTILLGPPLVVLALAATGRRLGLAPGPAALAGFFGGLVPGLTLLVQESFLSHALGLPFLLLLPVLLHAYTVERTGSALATAVLCLGSLASVYTEFLAFELLLVAAFAGVALAQRRGSWHLAGYALLLAAPWLCNPLYRSMNQFLVPGTLTAPVLGHVYPWAYEGTCVAVVWAGDSWAGLPIDAVPAWAVWLGGAVFACGAAGLLARLIASRGGAILAATLLGLALVPVALLCGDQGRHPYQFVKLLFTASPLYALGAVLLADQARRWYRPAAALAWLPAVLAAAVAAAGSARMVAASADPAVSHWRTNQRVTLDPDFQQLRRLLEATEGQPLLARPSVRADYYLHCWALYFARHNRVWMGHPLDNDSRRVTDSPTTAHLADLRHLPVPCLVLCPRNSPYLQPPPSLLPAAVVGQTRDHLLWRYDGGPWAGLREIDNPNGPEADERCFWLGGGATAIHLHATEPGVVRLRATFLNGPSLDPADRLLLAVHGACEAVQEMKPGPFELAVAVRAGMNTLSLRPLNAPRRTVPGDPRPMVAWLRLDGLAIEPKPCTGK